MHAQDCLTSPGYFGLLSWGWGSLRRYVVDLSSSQRRLPLTIHLSNCHFLILISSCVIFPQWVSHGDGSCCRNLRRAFPADAGPMFLAFISTKTNTSLRVRPETDLHAALLTKAGFFKVATGKSNWPEPLNTCCIWIHFGKCQTHQYLAPAKWFCDQSSTQADEAAAGSTGGDHRNHLNVVVLLSWGYASWLRALRLPLERRLCWPGCYGTVRIRSIKETRFLTLTC